MRDMSRGILLSPVAAVLLGTISASALAQSTSTQETQGAAAAGDAVPAAAATKTTATNSHWPSKWGADDTLGSLNYLGPDKAARAATLVKQGKSLSLGIVIGRKTPAYPPRGFNMTIVQPGLASGGSVGETKTTYNDDILQTWIGGLEGCRIDGEGQGIIPTCSDRNPFDAAPARLRPGARRA